MNYTKVDIDEWSRGSLFQFYIEKTNQIIFAVHFFVNIFLDININI